MSLKHRYAAWCELLAHYRRNFSWFWQHRNAMTPPALKAEEAEFLPAALSLQLKPASPTARWTGRILMMMVLFLFLWSFFGRVDIIVSASGKIIPSERSKTIAAVETARVMQIFVSNGQKVRAGEPLLVLDSGIIDHEQKRAQISQDMAALQVLRSRALLSSIEAGRLLPLNGTDGLAADRVEEARNQLESQWFNIASRLRDLDGEITRYNLQLPIVSKRVQNYKALAKNHDVAVTAWEEKEQERIELQGKLADARHQRAAFLAETRKNIAEELTSGMKQQQEAQQDVLRAAAHKTQLQINAPVDGIVQQLTTHTVGGVASAAAPLMVIVPEQSRVEIEAIVENKDIGFIEKGQKAAVKIEAYDYTKYGMLNGVVTYVARDALNAGTDNISPQSSGDSGNELQKPQTSQYTVHVQLDRRSMDIDGNKVTLRPGMSSSIEIKTGSRRVIDYFLSPLIQHTHESLNER
ncbi:hypothetical protein ASE99_23835 [Serratia sp. Leaf51]|nr:hypothetical protein ASE99_23835 [Serratia sp. Leaf51]